jgi:hypothetical protein
VFSVILAPTIPKEDDVPMILEPEPSPQVPEELPATVRPVSTGMMSLPLCNEVSGNQTQLKSFQLLCILVSLIFKMYSYVLLCYLLIINFPYSVLSLNSV